MGRLAKFASGVVEVDVAIAIRTPIGSARGGAWFSGETRRDHLRPPFRALRRQRITNVIVIATALSIMIPAMEATARMTREQSKAATRERLLDAARSVFAASGFHGASVEEVAAAAGFSTGALYSNFEGKEDLFLALMEREIDEHAREIADAVSLRESVSERATGG